jgi:hypothetical protein
MDLSDDQYYKNVLERGTIKLIRARRCETIDTSSFYLHKYLQKTQSGC